MQSNGIHPKENNDVLPYGTRMGYFADYPCGQRAYYGLSQQLLIELARHPEKMDSLWAEIDTLDTLLKGRKNTDTKAATGLPAFIRNTGPQCVKGIARRRLQSPPGQKS